MVAARRSASGCSLASPRKDTTDVRASLLKQTLRVGVAAGAAGTMLFTLAPAAHAAGLPTVIAAAGSDTTEDLMDQILTGTNQYNIHALQTPNLTVPADDYCGSVTYNATASAGVVASPNGSGSGRNALKGTAQGTYPTALLGSGKGCIDIARSSAEPRGTAGGDLATFQYYAFALDAVGWASPSLSAPAAITKAQLKGIYNCTIRDWSQLPGGGKGPIQRFAPQSNSGTGATFIAKVLDGVNPTTVSDPNPDASGNPCPSVIATQENRGNEASMTGAAYQQAITAYSAGKWNYHANNSSNPTQDLRAGARIGGFINGSNVAEFPVRWNGTDSFRINQVVVTTANEAADPLSAPFPGVRFLYNVIDPGTINFAAAQGIVGFDDIPGGAKSPLCSGSSAGVIVGQGFLPIAAGTTAGGNTLVTCRLKTTS
jgi:phosphate transport system substrate-binding protein